MVRLCTESACKDVCMCHVGVDGVRCICMEMSSVSLSESACLLCVTVRERAYSYRYARGERLMVDGPTNSYVHRGSAKRTLPDSRITTLRKPHALCFRHTSCSLVSSRRGALRARVFLARGRRAHGIHTAFADYPAQELCRGITLFINIVWAAEQLLSSLCATQVSGIFAGQSTRDCNRTSIAATSG